MDLLDRMLGFDQWATKELLERSRDLTDAQLDQEFDIGHRSLRTTFRHMIGVVDFWTDMMLGQPWDRSPAAERSIEDLLARHERAYPRFADLARRLQAEERLDETFIDHYDLPKSFGATIVQVVVHNAQHRSEARHILERLGVPDLWDFDPQEWEMNL